MGSLSVDEAAPRSAAGLPTVVVFDKVSGNEARFELDGVFDSGCSQREVFAAMGTHHVSSVIDGFNSTIFAYGRTSSGKTHSITGPLAARGGSDGGWSLRELEREAADPVHSASQLGLVPRTLHALLRAVEAAREGRHFTACFACAEIYNRSLFDLCTEDGGRAEVRDGRMSAAAAERLTWHHIDRESDSAAPSPPGRCCCPEALTHRSPSPSPRSACRARGRGNARGAGACWGPRGCQPCELQTCQRPHRLPTPRLDRASSSAQTRRVRRRRRRLTRTRRALTCSTCAA